MPFLSLNRDSGCIAADPGGLVIDRPEVLPTGGTNSTVRGPPVTRHGEAGGVTGVVVAVSVWVLTTTST